MDVATHPMGDGEEEVYGGRCGLRRPGWPGWEDEDGKTGSISSRAGGGRTGLGDGERDDGAYNCIMSVSEGE